MTTATRLRVLASVLLLACTGAQANEPFTPRDDATVLHRVLHRVLDGVLDSVVSPASRDDSARLRAARDAAPGELAPAVALAQHHLAIGLSAPSARQLGYAQAALRPWWDLAQAPLEVRRIRAQIAQHQHEFETALVDLDAIIEHNPRDVSALTVRAGIHEARGAYRQTAADCRRLALAGARVQSTVCMASVASLTGDAAAAYELLRRGLARLTMDSATRQWATTVLAEVAARAGHTDRAGQHYEAALRMPARSVYLLASYADFCLRTGAAARVVELLAAEDHVDTLLVRRALARRALNQESHADTARAMQRIEALRLRGDRSHLLEQARLVLSVDDDARTALELALESWSRERSPGAARFILDLAHRLQASEPAVVLQWVESSGARSATRDAALQRNTATMTS